MDEKRRRQLETRIREIQEQLKDCEDGCRLSDNPLEKQHAERRASQLRQLLGSYRAELSMAEQRDGASVAQLLTSSVRLTKDGHRVLEFGEDQAREVVAVLRDLRDAAAELTVLAETLRQRGITITGDGNVVGSNNQVIVVKSAAAQDAVREISDAIQGGGTAFVDRENELHLLSLERLKAALSPYTLISAPAGYGKSSLLQRLVNIAQSGEAQRQGWLCTIVDCSQTGTDPIGTLVRAMSGVQVNGQGAQDASNLTPDAVCRDILRVSHASPSEGRRAVLLIFDAVERLDDKSRQWLYALFHSLRTRTQPGLREIITVRVIISGRDAEPFWDGFVRAFPRPLVPRRIELSPFSAQPVQELIWRRARTSHVDLDDQLVVEMADELQYLSGGHPAVICRLVDHLAEQSFAIGPPSQYFLGQREHLVGAVLAPVASDLLESLQVTLGLRARDVVQVLSVFRRVNANTVQALVEAGELPPETNEIDLLGDMQRAHLLDGPTIREPFYRNRLLRRILALDMAYGSEMRQARYYHLNDIAVDLYRSWIHNLGRGLPDTHLKAVQRLLSVVEWLFHALQDAALDERALRAGLQEHIQAFSEDGEPLPVADLIAGEIEGDAEMGYLLGSRLGKQGVSAVCGWLRSARST